MTRPAQRPRRDSSEPQLAAIASVMALMEETARIQRDTAQILRALSAQGGNQATIQTLASGPRYTGRQVWNRQRTDRDLATPPTPAWGNRPVQRWNLPAGWVISARPAHPALVGEADFIAARDASAPRGPAGPATRRYLLAGLLVCGVCGRRLESAWSNGKPAYRCRHGYTSATRPDPGRPKNLYIREDTILPRLAALAILRQDSGHQSRSRKRVSRQITAPAQAADPD